MAPGGGPAGPAVHVPPPNPATAGDDPADDWVQDEPEEEEVGPVGGSSMPGGSQPGGPMGALPGGPTGAASRMRQNPANAPSAEPVATTAFDEGGPVEFLYFQPLTLVEACQDYVRRLHRPLGGRGEGWVADCVALASSPSFLASSPSWLYPLPGCTPFLVSSPSWLHPLPSLIPFLP